MSIQKSTVVKLLCTIACVALSTAASAQNQVLSLGKPYAYFQTVPGQPPNHYADDGPINGPHPVHTTGLGTYGLGNLTDGAISAASGAGPGTPHLGFWAMCCGNAPAASIIIDLGTVALVTDFTIGTVIGANSNNNAPDDVTVSFSIAGTTYGSDTYYNLEPVFGPLQDGHHDMKLKAGSVIPARFVKFSFDGGSMKEPSGQDPDEKWMLDEITIFGLGSSCTASSSSFGPGLAGQLGVPTLTASAPPQFEGEHQHHRCQLLWFNGARDASRRTPPGVRPVSRWGPCSYSHSFKSALRSPLREDRFPSRFPLGRRASRPSASSSCSSTAPRPRASR